MSELPAQREGIHQAPPPLLDMQDAETASVDEDEAVDALTAYFRRTSRGRIVDLPRWAQ